MADADPRNRLNHYGSQPISSVRELQTSLDGKQPKNEKLSAISASPLRKDAPEGQIPVFVGNQVQWKKIGLGADNIPDVNAFNYLLNLGGGGGGGNGDAHDVIGEINVADYGAEGDGTTDDTTAFEDADTAALETGSRIVVPSGTFRIASDLTLASQVLYKTSQSQIVPDAGVDVHHSAGYVADDWAHCFDISASGSSVTGDQAPRGYVTPQHFGADPSDTAVDDRPAIEAAIEFATIAPIRDEYANGLPVKFPVPPTGDYYLTKTRPIYVARTTHLFGDAHAYLRTQSGVEIRAADGLDAVMFAFYPGGSSAPASYETTPAPGAATPGISKAYSALRSKITNLTFLPESGASVKHGFVHNAICFLENCAAAGFTQSQFYAHAQTTGGIDKIFSHPGTIADGTTMGYSGIGSTYGNTNGSTYINCYAQNGVAASGQNGGAHGFVSRGNNSGTVRYISCDAAHNDGAGFLESSTIGCAYIGTTSTANAWVISGRGTTLLTTLANSVAGGATSVDMTSAASIAVNARIAIVLDSGASWVCTVTAKATNTLTVTPAAPSAATAANNVYATVQYVCVKGHTSAAADEPGVGANWRTYWYATGYVAGTIDGNWTSGAYYHPGGGANISTITSYSSFFDHYSEGSEEGGVFMRDRCQMIGGVGSVRAPWHGEFNTAFVKVAGQPSGASPVGYAGRTDPSDAATDYGMQLGASSGYINGRIAQFGSGLDDSTNKTTAMRFAWNATRGRYEWSDASNTSRPCYGVSGNGYTGTGYSGITQAFFWANGFYLGDGTTTGIVVNRLRSVQTAASITSGNYGTTTRGDTWLYTQPTAGGRVGSICTTTGDGTIGSTAVVSEFGDIVLAGSATWDPASCAAGVSVETTVTVTGAALGDYAIASFSLNTSSLLINARVTATNTVTVSLFNPTGSAVDLASGTVRARVFKQ